MTVIKPFRALRPTPDKAEAVSCVPYDVVHESEVRELLREDPLTFLQVTRPDAALGEGETPADSLKAAKENLRRLIEEKVLVNESEPSVYVYRLSTGGNTQIGVVACCSIDEYDRGLIKKHEKTRPDKVADRADHMIELSAQTGLIFLAFRGTARINELIGEAVKGTPLFDFPGINDTQQTVWRITGGTEFIEAFAEVPALYIADGHHRIESASLVRKRMRAENPEHTGTEEYNYVLAGMFPAEDLRILAYNRAVHDLNGASDEEFLERLRRDFVVKPSAEKEPRTHGSFGMYFGGKWYSIEFAGERAVAADPIEELDVSILQDRILRPILGIDDPRTNDRVEFIGGARGTAELERLVDEGSMKVAFSLFPTTMEDLLTVSDMDAIMPPKSTWFEPKLRDGLFVHLI